MKSNTFWIKYFLRVMLMKYFFENDILAIAINKLS